MLIKWATSLFERTRKEWVLKLHHHLLSRTYAFENVSDQPEAKKEKKQQEIFGILLNCERLVDLGRRPQTCEETSEQSEECFTQTAAPDFTCLLFYDAGLNGGLCKICHFVAEQKKKGLCFQVGDKHLFWTFLINWNKSLNTSNSSLVLCLLIIFLSSRATTCCLQ